MTPLERRVLAWSGCLNVRDLGGLRTEDGGRTRTGAVVRADSVRRLSDDGWRALVDYGVGTIVDLRFRSEMDADPPRELDLDVVHVPVLPDRSSTAGPSTRGDVVEWRELERLMLAAPDEVGATHAIYREFLIRFHERFVDAIRAVARAREGGVVVHCVGGKDRTGLVSALLLRLAGVAPRLVADDYGVSARNLEPRDAAWVAAAEDELERMRRRRIAASPRDAMARVLADLEGRHGSVASYLEAGGLSASDVARARARLRDGR